ncbi:hypothetical protein PENSOL_c069G06440 [Penicillium solitum]|uniref:Uncharacterized protein n=1 Tax=Penicillium solitum TaxID=60172 RepID=A0A1V6QH99_9EURO|nr:uncharacterized protein PENSOL_c069G06440 [Penicillium solitum]OQD88604.1 hypothetical protein PENSOL_c069G06440 [Penicillium solitum]
MEDTSRPPHLGGRPVDQETVLPLPMEGENVAAPGSWAAHIRNLPFSVARCGDRLKGPYLDRLLVVPRESRREPYLRVGRQWTALRFQQQINVSLAHAEAALMQVVGNQALTPCNSCLRREGPFSHCVSVRDVSGLEACANCHWAGRDNRCHYRQSFQTVTSQHTLTITETPRHDDDHPSTIRANPHSSQTPTPQTDTNPTGQCSGQRAIVLHPLESIAQVLESSRGFRAQMEELLDQVHSVQTPSTADLLLQRNVDNVYNTHCELDQHLRQSYNMVMDILDYPARD